MVTSWIEQARQFKSPLRVVGGFLLRSRETQRAKKRYWQEQCQDLKKQLDQKLGRIEEQAEEIARLKRRLRDLERERDEAAKTPSLPDDPPVASHGYGPRMISLAVNLARGVGLRGSERTLKIFLIGWRSSRRFPTSPRSATG
jgi:hypothetical protein